MVSLPRICAKGTVNRSPHVVILGAGASRASFQSGDGNGLKLPLMNDFVESVPDLKDLLKRKKIGYQGKNFEVVYNDLCEKKESTTTGQIQALIEQYFSKMQLPEELTIYDKLILSLRKKDLIATFNWDPLLLKAYIRNSQIKELPKLAFLHGNVGVGVCQKDKMAGNFGNLCSECGSRLEPSNLLYPIKQKDYNKDPYIKGEWDLLLAYLNIAYFVTIFGYNAPITDVEAKRMLQEVWNKNETKDLAQIEIIDIKSSAALEETWKDFIVSHHYFVSDSFDRSYLARYPRRSCDAFAGSSLLVEPWEDNPIPKFTELPELLEWIQPLIKEELKFEKDGSEFSKLPCGKIK